MSPIFELRSNEDSQFYFHFINSNKQLLLISDEFENKQKAEQAIKEVQKGSLMNEQISAGQTAEGSIFFVIKDSAGDVLAKSVLFETRMLFDNGLHNVKDNACIAETNDLT